MAIVRQTFGTWDAQGASLVMVWGSGSGDSYGFGSWDAAKAILGMVWEVEVATVNEILQFGCSECQSRDGFEDEDGEIYRDVAPCSPRIPFS